MHQDDCDALSVSSGGTSRGRQRDLRRLSSRDDSSYSSSPGSRIDEYERRHTKPKKRTGDMIFEIVPSKHNQNGVAIEEFPNEVLTHILSHLPPETLSSMSLVSRRFHKLVTTPPAWRIAFARYFPAAEALATGPKLAVDVEKSQRRSFTRLSALASWRSEYILRTRLIRSLGRGRPAIRAVPKPSISRSSANAGLNAAVTTYQSGLMFPISHMHATFGVGLNKTQPLFIHGAAEQGLVSSSDPMTGKIAHWGLADYQAFHHFGDLYAGEAEYGLGPGDVVGLPNSLDVSQPYGRVYGEGCPGGRLFYTASNEQRGRFLPTSSSANHALGIPEVTMIGCSVTSVWMAKSEAVLKVTTGVFGLLAGFSNGIVAAYALGNNPVYDRRYTKGEATAKWVLSPGVPITAIIVDEHASARKLAAGRVWAVALNALGEVYYLTETPLRPDPQGKTTAADIDCEAWRTGRSVEWALVEETRRKAKLDPFSTSDVDGSYTPRISGDRTALDKEQRIAEAKEVEKYIQYPPKHFRAICDGWDMQRKALVDFGGDCESIVIINRGLAGDPASVKRFTRHRQKLSLNYDLEKWPTVRQAAPHVSIFGGVATASSASPAPSVPRSRTSSTEDVATQFQVEWRTSSFALGEMRNVQITTVAIDESDFACLATMEDPLLGMSAVSGASSPIASPLGRGQVIAASSDVPGHRARFMAVGTKTGAVLLWNIRASLSPAVGVVNTVTPVRAIHTKSPEVSSIALTALYVVHGGNDGLVQAWDPLTSTLEPIRTLNSRFSDRARRRIAQADASAQGVGHNYFAAAAIVLDPDPTILRGMVSLGTHLRYWSYSSTAADAYKSRKRGQLSRRSGRGSNDGGTDHKVTATGRGVLKDYIVNEQIEMEREKIARRKAHERLSGRFGTTLLGEDASEEELLAYATMLSEESLKSDAVKRASQDSSAIASPHPSSKAEQVVASNPGDLDAELEEALRLSLLDSEQVASSSFPPQQIDEPALSIPIRYAKGVKRTMGSAKTNTAASGSKTQKEADDLEFALQLSLAEEQSRLEAADESQFPPLESRSSSEDSTQSGKGKGKRKAHRG
ncbi:uncharacterized protein HMPREF1541_03545 [Cyphellophora europaea CBS 101466]|uniref:F-box domain-containing protein n=1 Tax=Cyphellophora europaea (strain CBS 101466) TaxID=1220924 RepID=W2S0X4_CYPE1|nr:uncharacterized protein HMPREF1541_03545 [Cyphellophora europaea CBS 101466]ETN41609.1 hypothetical protein HMPREF1541_03545 [Cyphellophora europaea CBS 101466]